MLGISLCLEGEDRLPVILHADDGPAFGYGFIPARRSWPMHPCGRRPIRARRRCGGRRGRSASRYRRRSIGAFAGRHRNCRRRRSAGGRCAAGCRRVCRSLSSMKLISGSFTSTGFPSRISNFCLAAAADDLLGRDAIDLLRPRPHELDAAAGNNEGLEAVRAQIGEQLEHRLIDHLRVEAAWSSDASRWRSSR